jgi:cytochrome c oxidase assembly factor CtaG
VHPYSFSLHAETVVVVPLVALAYAFGTRVAQPTNRQLAGFLTALALIVVAFVTPLESLALHYLLTAHLLQNVVLAEWAPALLVLGLPAAVRARIDCSRVLRSLTTPLVALPLWLGTYFAWHVPAAYDYALRHSSTVLHLEHVCYLAAGVVFWWPVLARRLHPGAAAAYLFAGFVLASPLGLLLALVPRPVYDFYEHAPRLWGLSPLTDQQIAGLTMAAEQAVVLFAAFAYFFLRFLRSEETLFATDRFR